jgi:hypothetical protein
VAAKRRYEEDLRAIGQALEARDISVFELTRFSDWYVIQDVRERSGSLRSKILRWLRLRSGSSAESLTLSFADVEKLSQAGLARRSKPGQLTNFRSLSNLLRTIGAYLDSKEAELFELKKRPISMSLWYRDKAGQEQREDRTISSFYNLFLELCGKRGQTQQTPISKN